MIQPITLFSDGPGEWIYYVYRFLTLKQRYTNYNIFGQIEMYPFEVFSSIKLTQNTRKQESQKHGKMVGCLRF